MRAGMRGPRWSTGEAIEHAKVHDECQREEERHARKTLQRGTSRTQVKLDEGTQIFNVSEGIFRRSVILGLVPTTQCLIIQSYSPRPTASTAHSSNNHRVRLSMSICLYQISLRPSLIPAPRTILLRCSSSYNLVKWPQHACVGFYSSQRAKATPPAGLMKRRIPR